MVHLYRVRDGAFALLYIGVTENLWSRFLDGHQHSARWWLDMRALSVDRYSGIRAARAAETSAIAAEHPKWNIAGSANPRLARLLNFGPRPELGPGFEQERIAQWDRAQLLIREALRCG